MLPWTWIPTFAFLFATTFFCNRGLPITRIPPIPVLGGGPHGLLTWPQRYASQGLLEMPTLHCKIYVSSKLKHQTSRWALSVTTMRRSLREGLPALATKPVGLHLHWKGWHLTLYSCAHQVVGWSLSVQLGLLTCSPRSYQAQLLSPLQLLYSPFSPQPQFPPTHK